MTRSALPLRRLGGGLLGVALLMAAACQTNTGTALDRKSTQGAIIGVLTGAAAGAAVDDHERGRGALIGAAVGGLAGGVIGHYLDKQAEELDAIPDADVERREEVLVVGFPSDTLFDVGSFALSPGAYSRLDQVADTLMRYPDTEVVVKGHSDASGSESYNLRLSEDRADAVRRYLVSRGVPAYRVSAIGFGEAMPVATNATPEGRQQNRRVELEIRPSDQLREEHRRQADQDPYGRPVSTEPYDRRDPYPDDDRYRRDPYPDDRYRDDAYGERYLDPADR